MINDVMKSGIGISIRGRLFIGNVTDEITVRNTKSISDNENPNDRRNTIFIVLFCHSFSVSCFLSRKGIMENTNDRNHKDRETKKSVVVIGLSLIMTMRGDKTGIEKATSDI